MSNLSISTHSLSLPLVNSPHGFSLHQPHTWQLLHISTDVALAPPHSENRQGDTTSTVVKDGSVWERGSTCVLKNLNFVFVKI